jgi:hypothetical protein
MHCWVPILMLRWCWLLGPGALPPSKFTLCHCQSVSHRGQQAGGIMGPGLRKGQARAGECRRLADSALLCCSRLQSPLRLFFFCSGALFCSAALDLCYSGPLVLRLSFLIRHTTTSPQFCLRILLNLTSCCWLWSSFLRWCFFLRWCSFCSGALVLRLSDSGALLWGKYFSSD